MAPQTKCCHHQRKEKGRQEKNILLFEPQYRHSLLTAAGLFLFKNSMYESVYWFICFWFGFKKKKTAVNKGMGFRVRKTCIYSA